MDPAELRIGRPSTPRRELQGPRPTPLKVQKDSHKIKKPPVAPPPQHRPPVIIYTVSPKVIHTTPGDFMSLVQRLTGASSSSSSAAAAASRPASNVNIVGEPLSPAVRLATIEKGAHKLDVEMQRKKGEDILGQLGIDGAGMTTMNRHSSFPGILSPVPASLPSVSPNFFPTSMETTSLSFFHELSPVFHGNRNFLENTFLASPNYNFLATPVVPSPGAYWDLFNQYQDF